MFSVPALRRHQNYCNRISKSGFLMTNRKTSPFFIKFWKWEVMVSNFRNWLTWCWFIINVWKSQSHHTSSFGVGLITFSSIPIVGCNILIRSIVLAWSHSYRGQPWSLVERRQSAKPTTPVLASPNLIKSNLTHQINQTRIVPDWSANRIDPPRLIRKDPFRGFCRINPVRINPPQAMIRRSR